MKLYSTVTCLVALTCLASSAFGQSFTVDPQTGYTRLVPTTSGTFTSRLIYVDNSSGSGCSDSDTTAFHMANDPLVGGDPRRPVNAGALKKVCSIERAMTFIRNDHPDWVLMKKGTTQAPANEIPMTRSGKSASERIVITSYGTGTRPRLFVAPNAQFAFGRGHPSMSIGHLAIVGLDVMPHPGKEYTQGFINWQGGPAAGSFNILIEDNRWAKLFRGPVLQEIVNIDIRHNVISDFGSVYSTPPCDYQLGGPSPQSMYVALSKDITVENNIITNRFFTYGLRNVTIQDSAIYLQGDNQQPVSVNKNIVIYKGQYGPFPALQLRPGGSAHDNFFYGVGASIAAGSTTQSSLVGNVTLRGVDVGPTGGCIRGTGLQIEGGTNSVVRNNISALKQSIGYDSATGIYLKGGQNTLVEDNLSFNWAGVGFQDSASGVIRNNELQNHQATSPLTWVWSTSALPRFSISGNRYFSVGAADRQFRVDGVWRDLAWWQANVDGAAVQQQMSYPNGYPASTNGDHLVAYAHHIGLGGLDELIDALNMQSQDNFVPELSIDALLCYVRTSFGRNDASCSAGTPPATVVVTASAGPNGSILPSGQLIVPTGSSLPFEVRPDRGYMIADVTVNGRSQCSGDACPSTFELTNVQAASSVTVSFTPAVTRCGRVDLDGDGLVSEADFALFSRYFSNGDIRADADGNGLVNIADTTAFLQAYAGCLSGGRPGSGAPPAEGAAEPVVNITAVPSSSATTEKPALFTIFRTGDLSSDLTVRMTIRGTASAGVDYRRIPRRITIPAGEASVQLRIKALANRKAVRRGTVQIVLSRNPAYKLGMRAARVTIKDKVPHRNGRGKERANRS